LIEFKPLPDSGKRLNTTSLDYILDIELYRDFALSRTVWYL
jgi:hypothetical protein